MQNHAEYQRRWKLRNPERVAVYKKRQAAWRDAHREELNRKGRERAARWREANPETWSTRWRSERLMKKYGITLEQYGQLVLRQRGRCAICGKKHFDKPRKRLHVDHDHKTGKIRGLLCSLCNSTLGHGRDNPKLLRKAADYLDIRR